jgi:hypothetical protein
LIREEKREKMERKGNAFNGSLKGIEPFTVA